MDKIRGKRSRSRIAQRRTEAKDREAARNLRSHEEQLELIKTRSGNSEKEKHRLVALIEKAYEDAKKNKKKKRKNERLRKQSV
jgi:hypothetical protein